VTWIFWIACRVAEAWRMVSSHWKTPRRGTLGVVRSATSTSSMRVAGVPGEPGGGNGGGLATLHIFGAKERIGGRRRRDDGLTDDRHFELEHRHNAGK
jgi:hypothetical protein